MTRRAIVFGLVLLTGACAFAGSADSPPLTYPQRSLEFEVDEDLRLDAFDGLDLAYRTKSSDTRGWRFGVSLDARSEENESGNEIIDGTSSNSTRETSSYGVRLLAQKLFFSQPRHGASFYWGVGPNVSYSNYNSKAGSGSDTSATNENDATFYSAGLVADVGVEWRVAAQLSVEARYRWSAGYYHNKQSTDYYIDGGLERTSSSETDTFSLEGGDSVDLLVAFHF